MRIRLYYIPLLLLVIAGLHFVALYGGVYDAQIEAEFIWWDNVLHFFVGIVFAIAWLWYLQWRQYESFSRFTILSTLAFVLVMAISWELFEYFARLFYRGLVESLQLYSPNLVEALSDIASNIVGATVLLIVKERLEKTSNS